MSNNCEPKRFASSVTCGRRLSSARLFSRATRILRYICAGPRLPAEPFGELVEQQFDVQSGDYKRDGPREHLEPERIDEFAHLSPVAGEHHQREDREGKLQTENHLAQHEKVGGAFLA